ncbi:TPA: UDP-galactopyranose mutase [Burkholderia vietnamiensis]|nr:UDP-galactopyranose mutase [Burkholderia vietnamiensis]HDR9248407.1 UDP-galactopyranose mutase [Burkholderia vietnamiensis]
MDMEKILIVGAGLSGAVIARELAEQGIKVTVVESRDHVAGNCHTERDTRTGVMVHVHGPHIFHTDNERVWNYVNSFMQFAPYICRVKATTGGSVYGLPINLHTINQFFGKTFNPKQAREFIEQQAEKSISEVRSFEDQALRFLGKDLYHAFFRGYPIKQWGLPPSELPASVLKRLPIRFNYDDNYFSHRFQGMPVEGYTVMVQRMLDHENIDVHLRTEFDATSASKYDHVFFSGPLDSWFEHKLGRLAYRTLTFEPFYDKGDFQGCAVMSYPDEDVPYTRITEHKHFTPWEEHEETIVFKEFSSQCRPGDIPYYPIRLVEDKAMLRDYVDLAEAQRNVTFVGRLGTYRYLDMDVTIAEALDVADSFLKARATQARMPAFVVSPL